MTGGCSGIGKEIARQLAQRGHDLVLVSERSAPLVETAQEIASEQGVTVHPLSIDLARPDAAAEVYQTVHARGWEVEILVNNAGTFFFGEAVDAEEKQAGALLQLHVVTPSLLSTRFGFDMRARGRGHILIVSSISAQRDFPGIAYYGTSKKYLRGFACALRSELAIYGVNVTCLLPGATATGLYDPNVVPVELARRLGVMMPPEEVARAGLEAMFAGRAECTPGLLTRALGFTAALTPQPVIDLIRRRSPWLRRTRAR